MATREEYLKGASHYSVRVLDPRQETQDEERSCMPSVVEITEEQLQKLCDGWFLYFGDAEYGHFIRLT